MKAANVVNFSRNVPRTWEECLNRFLTARRRQGLSARTLLDHERVIEMFFRRYPTAWSGTCQDCLDAFLGQPGISPTTHNIRLKSLRPFFDFAAREGAFSTSPADGFKYRRGEEPRIVDLPLADVKKVLDVIGTGTFVRLRDSALLLFSIDSGIRPSEALSLRVSDVNTLSGKAAIKAVSAKTRRPRMVYFTQPTAALIERLIDFRPPEWNSAVPLFCTTYGDQWNTHAWSVQLRRYGRKAGLRRLSAYDLRHMHALESLRNGANVFTLQRTMGHAQLSMTEKYLALSDEDLQHAHQESSPINALLPAPRRRA